MVKEVYNFVLQRLLGTLGLNTTRLETTQKPEKANIFVRLFIQLPYYLGFFLLMPLLAFAYSFCLTLFELMGASSSFPSKKTHVPMFYVPKHAYLRSFQILPLTVLGTVFGGIHCFGWNFSFPTHTERILWRIASLCVAITPIAAFPLTRIMRFIRPFFQKILTIIGITDLFLGHLHCIVVALTSSQDTTNREEVEAFLSALINLMFIYVPARLLLFGLCLAQLRDLPPNAFTLVNWTKFYPHVF